MSSPPLSISGFTIVRNAEILDYPFQESIRSVMRLCDEFVINCGTSEDDTLKLCEALQREFPGKIKVIETKWDLENQKSGLQLKLQTDRALRECQGRWCFYIQADEAVHENDLEKIKLAIVKADSRSEIDGLLFEYTHFYGDYRWAIRGRNWYRREVRCFKNGRGIEAFRDAQGFRKQGVRLSVVSSGARIFHYGYVRNSKGLETKSKEMGKWWETSKGVKQRDYRLIRHVGLYRFKETHPRVLQERIVKNEVLFDPSKAPRKLDRRELKNILTLVWESLTGIRIGEFRNYEIKGEW